MSTNLLSPAIKTVEKLPTATAPSLALDSSDLLRGAKAVSIQHNGAVYRLQATRLGKLILTK